MKLVIVIIGIVVFSVAYVLVKGMYKQDQKSKEKSRIGAGESGEAASDDSGDE
jgi:hypothetical protein